MKAAIIAAIVCVSLGTTFGTTIVAVWHPDHLPLVTALISGGAATIVALVSLWRGEKNLSATQAIRIEVNGKMAALMAAVAAAERGTAAALKRAQAAEDVAAELRARARPPAPGGDAPIC